MDAHGFYMYTHYEKPQRLSIYEKTSINPLFTYQRDSFAEGFKLIANSLKSSTPNNIIFDRFHLGEYVYSPMYRNYSGDYVFDLEERTLNEIRGRIEDVRLILLTSSNFDFIEDDGLSFDSTKKEEEQKRFIEAFNKSAIVSKRLIDVHDGSGKFKTHKKILDEALS